MRQFPREAGGKRDAGRGSGTGTRPDRGGGSIRPFGGALFRGARSKTRPRAGTFTDVPTTLNASASPSAVRTAAALASSVLLSPLLAGTAHAAPADGGRPPKAPVPPAKMSQVGGERLGRPGVQVQLRPGAPELPKELTGRSWIISDAETGEVLAAKNPHWQLAPASTLKMLFADTVLPKFPKTTKYTVKAADLAGMGVGSSLVGIKENLTYTVHDLWLGVFLRSGNDAVHTLSAMNGGTEATVKQMQQRAVQLNAGDTHVVTPDGYDAPGQVSSAYDLSLFARAGLQNPDFREYCSTASAQFPGDLGKDGKRATFGIQNTNRLLSGDYDIKPYPGIAGVKNGSTTNAGSTFTGFAQHGDRKLLVTVMNPEKKQHNEAYREAAKLFDWGFAADGKVTPVGSLVEPKGSGKDQGDAKNGDPQAQAGLDSGGWGGPWTVAGIGGGVVALIAAAAWFVRRRRPQPEAGGGTGQDAAQGRRGGSGGRRRK